jgi:glycerophosphoryl diester phosphodiesterase
VAHPFLDHGAPIPFAHRGGGTTYENSLAAFARAIEIGYRYLETDVVATADGVLLTFHDRTLRRLTGERGHVAQMTHADVRRMRIRDTEPVATLEDVLETWPHVRVNIDVKHSSAIGPLVDVISRTNALDRVCVASFSDRRLAAVRAALGPRLCTSLGPRGVLRFRAAATRRLPRRLAPVAPCIQIPEHIGPVPVLTPALIDLAHEDGQQVHVWTVNRREDMHRLLDAGVDGIMTDELAILRDVLISRGTWKS